MGKQLKCFSSRQRLNTWNDLAFLQQAKRKGPFGPSPMQRFRWGVFTVIVSETSAPTPNHAREKGLADTFTLINPVLPCGPACLTAC